MPKVLMCGTSAGKSTGLSPALMLALGGMLEQPQKTGDQMAEEFIQGMLEGRPTDTYDPIPARRAPQHSRCMGGCGVQVQGQLGADGAERADRGRQWRDGPHPAVDGQGGQGPGPRHVGAADRGSAVAVTRAAGHCGRQPDWRDDGRWIDAGCKLLAQPVRRLAVEGTP